MCCPVTSLFIFYGLLGANAAPSMPVHARVTRKRAQSVASFAQPTESSNARHQSPSPIIRSTTTRSFSRPPASMGSRPATSMTMYDSSTKSSLSTLSLALEKLNAPTPSRPNTSLGFSRGRLNGTFDSDSDGETKSDSAMDVDSEPRPASPSVAAKMRTNAASSALNGKSSLPQYRRAATVGPPTLSAVSSAAKSGQGQGVKGKQPALMLPPPVPKNRTPNNGGTSVMNAPSTDKPSINLQSGVISGKPKGKFAFGNRTAGQSIFTFGGPSAFPFANGAAGAGGGRVVHRASKRTSLPMVEGSPVKRGGGVDISMEDAEEPLDTNEPIPSAGNPSQAAEEANLFAVGPSTPAAMPSTLTEDGTVAQEQSQERQKNSDVWKNESRRASMALHHLSQSLSEYPTTPQRKAPATEGKGKGRAVSSTYPSAGVPNANTAPGGLGKASGVGAHISRSRATRTTRATTAAVAAANAAEEASPASVPSTSSTPQSVEGAPKSVRVLKDCIVFVDVKTDDGVDAGSLFIDMLKGMGAKVSALYFRRS